VWLRGECIAENGVNTTQCCRSDNENSQTEALRSYLDNRKQRAVCAIHKVAQINCYHMQGPLAWLPENETHQHMRHPAHNNSNSSSSLAYMCRFMGGMMVKRMPPRYGSSMLSRVRDARPPESSGNKVDIVSKRYNHMVG
jgi:hypothetical protein